jgi:Ca-activated chloride channel family protein
MQLPRQIKNSLLPLMLLCAAQKTCAQLAPADDFFNGGAQFYISNNIPQAKDVVEMGLKLYPGDEKLKKLEALLKQQQQQSQNSQSQQNQQEQQSQSQQNSSNQQNQRQNQQQSQQNSQDQKKDEQQNQSEQQKSAGQKSNDEKESQDDENQAAAGQMTPEEARRLLDAQKDNEQILQMKPQGKPQDNQKPVKDW